MEIRFIWIAEYRGIIEKLNLNFQHRGPHKFNYSDGILEMSENKQSPLYFGDKIKGITAIAGKNGSGKSSVCEAILNAAATYVNGGWGWNHEFVGIVCYGDRIFYSKKIRLNNREQIEQNGYELKEFEESPFEKLPVEWRHEFHKGSFIYYSNVLDWRSEIYLTNLINISTQYLLANDFRYGTLKIVDSERNEVIPDVLKSYYYGQGYRNMKFYLNFWDKIPFETPKVLVLKSSYSAINRFLNFRSIGDYEGNVPFDQLEKRILEDIINFSGQLMPGPKISVDINSAKQGMKRLYRFNLLMINAINEEKYPSIDRAIDFVLNITDDFNLFSNSEDVARLIKTHESLVDLGKFEEKISPYNLNETSSFLNWKFFIIENLSIDNNEASRIIFKTFINLENKVLRGEKRTLKRISDYSFYPLPSTGEGSFYTLFSRLFDTLDRLDVGDERTDIVLFIDEGEVGFHPSWKKKYLKWIIDFINGEYNKYNFQIILTTHSPYILSDLSSDHTILLKREVDKTTEIVPSENYMTFGANIHDLLADTFFLSDGLIGEFAKQEIQFVIDCLNSWHKIKEGLSYGEKITVDETEKDRCREIIDIIGDVIVRNKLVEMYMELFDDEMILDNEISFLESRIKYLKERREK